MPQTDADADANADDCFEYTTGKWIYNDALRHSERRKIFNIPELKRLAAHSINQSENDLTGFKKLAEGGFNRTFLITMRDGFQFVARIPFPVTEPKSLLIANEVATMDFLRSHGFPIPRVFGYSTAADNPAGTEYIFMELVTGTNLGDVWFNLSEQEQTTIITNLVQIESKLMALRFPASGSLYYCDDLPNTYPRILIQPSNANNENSKQFCIGPDTSFRLWFGKRLNLNVERGPYQDCFAALTTGATKEIAYLSEFGKPLLPFQRLRREVHAYEPQSHKDHIQNLKKYLAIAPDLIPNGETDQYLHRPVIRHPDLQPNNVIVTESLQVKGLIDWQHSTILPLFLQSGIPLSVKSQDIVEPGLSSKESEPISSSLSHSDNDSGSESDIDNDSDDLLQLVGDSTSKPRHHWTSKELEIFRRRRLHREYLRQTAKLNPEHYAALSEKYNKLRRRLWHHAGDPWEGDTITLKSDLIVLSRRWADITGNTDVDSDADSDTGTGTTCPISFSDAEIGECLRLNAAQVEADEQLQECQDIVGVAGEGWTPIASYEKAKARAAKLKMEAFQAAESDEERRRLEENWIFDDFDEVDYT
ncbi:hypothetical protein N7509_012404 [Penicillium cosmopolitanum]|uniref:Aminoglycoside phosphotransferase domain-containing protein n=1 Tax=Penicillium cosmopolitanum TaxID=1131564 RepID=A0A9W9VH58_9EURO|nr:uncharacterized protein N7509_012404 [Penicillium cosmopolitanum]KAJ5379285.1 hypothetical protein N7509_012404 [Penicillium cosmopolitanum]